MPSRPKGFDPLSSLFEQTEPDASEETPQGPSGAASTDFAPVLEPTDSFFSAPAGGPRPPVARVATPAPAAPTPPPVDPVALARILARNAAARAGPPGSAPKKAPPATRAPATPAAEPASRPATRIEDLARRDLRARTAEEVLADLARNPEPRRPQDAPGGFSVREIQEIIAQKVRGMSEYRVANCVAAEPREVLRALWKAHRTRFASEGRLDAAVAAAAVLEALVRVPEGRLAVAHVITTAQDYLLWLDTEERRPIAGFSDARTLLAGR